MKRLVYILPLLLFLACLSCKKGRKTTNTNSIQQNNSLDTNVFLSATVNGALWQTDSVFGYYIKNAGNDSTQRNLYITATYKSSLTSIVLSINNYRGIGSYEINPPYVTATYYDNNKRYYGLTGSIDITTDGNYEMTGKFNFFSGSTTISDGLFNVARP